ncbi:MAG: cation:proton antiporter, partial [Myxococcota bacterium]
MTEEREDERTTYAAGEDLDEVLSVRIAEPDEVEHAGEASAHHDSHGHGGGRSAALRQVFLVTLLIVLMIVMHRFAVQDELDPIDPTAMLALGFVVLACFTIGALVDLVKLPHITGYLLAGIVFGPSIASIVGGHYQLLPPFDEGVLNNDVIKQLNPLKTLAVALIALTAGGELRVDALRKGLRAITGVLFVQMLTVLGLITAFFWAVSGTFPAIALPGLGDVSAAWLPIGLAVGAISFATSPAATVAIINETRAKGPMASTVMSSVVLKDVFVVLLFGIFEALSIQALGASSEGSLVNLLAVHIGGSIVAGILLGLLMALYMRYVARELMLFVAGIVFGVTVVAKNLELDSVLVFLTAGFFVANFERRGEELIHSVEKLSMPVFVVFFTLAGAQLHLDEVVHLLGFAFALVFVRIVAVYIGVRLGAIVGRADEATKKYGWMGFISQAGVAITFADIMANPTRFPEAVHALSGLLIAGVAINEVIGPVLLKVGLSLAGETGGTTTAAEEEVVQSEVIAFAEWPAHVREVDWGEPLDLDAPALEHELRDLEGELRAMVANLAAGPMAAFHQRAEGYLRELRREFLRHHRRLLVQARAVSAAEEGKERDEARAAFAAALRQEQAELADRWRTIVLTRSAQLRQRALWHPAELVEELDGSVISLPETLRVPYAERTFESQPSDSVPLRIRRWGLRVKRVLYRWAGRKLDREVPLRDLARYHLAGLAPVELESTAAVLVDAERHLAGRTRNLFDGVVHAYDELAAVASDPNLDLEARTESLREDVEEGLMLALDEAQRMASDGAFRTGRTLAAAQRTMKAELLTIGTLDLPIRQRQSSAVFTGRVKALQALSERVDELRGSSGGEFALLAMELELVGLEARLKDVVATHETRLRNELQGRVVGQARRALTALQQALVKIQEALSVRDGAGERTGAELEEVLREATEPVEHAAGEAARIVQEMRDELLDEDKFADLVKALRDTSDTLTPRYEVIAGRLLRGDERLPSPVPSVEVPFRELVSDYTETTVEPELLRTGRSAADTLQPLVLALKEAERAVAFVNVDVVSVDLEAFRDDKVPGSTLALLEEVFFGQLELVESTLATLAEASTEWPETYGTEVRRAVLGALDELRGEFADGKVTEATLNAIRKTTSRRRLAQQARDLPDLVKDGADELKATVVSVVGEARLARLREVLGVREERAETSFQSDAFSEPTPQVALPVVYR